MNINPIPAITELTGHPDSVPVIVGWSKPDFSHTCRKQKRVSATWLRRLQGFGMTRISLRISDEPERIVDFSIARLLESAEKGAAS